MMVDGEKVAKGRIICPKCKNEFILDLTEDKKIHNVICPKCDNKFSVKAKCVFKDLEWEEYGEPRKTILSCTKCHSKKPLIATILLFCVFLIGISSAVLFNTFIQTTIDAIYFMDFLKDIVNFNYSIIIIIFSVFTLFAIYACIKRKYFILAIVGSFIGIFSFGFYLINSILSIIALILIFISMDEFQDEKKGKTF